jgi:hypothetical protein
MYHRLVRLIPPGFHWPPPIGAIVLLLLIGAALLIMAIVIRRKSSSSLPALVVLMFAVLWNAAIVFLFMSPHNRHVFHLSTHRISVVVNALIGIVWCSLCVFTVLRWFRAQAA